MSLITISGSQGQGKSTVLTSLAERGFNIVTYKTSRLILDEWGVTLNEVNKDLELKKRYQNEVLIRHHQNNIAAIESNELYFSERSYADIFTYTLFSLGPFNEYSTWLDEYYEKCKAAQQGYAGIIRLSGRTANVDNDGVRSVNQHFTEAIDIVLHHYLLDFGGNVLHVDTPDHDERIGIILEKFG
jgi:predicted ATPase